MSVSESTSENSKDEKSHLSLAHKHCLTCISQTCNVEADNVTSCDHVKCPRGCPCHYHACKESEHQLLCSENRINCTNYLNGCPLLLLRKNLRQHLRTCPANVIYCSAEWNRCHIEKCEPQKEGGKAVLQMKKSYVECGQLDTALAMRDHRVLVDSLLVPPQTRRILRSPRTRIYPAALFGRLSSYSADSDASLCAETSKDLSDEEVESNWDSTSSWLETQRILREKKTQLYDVSTETAAALTSTNVSDQMESMSKEARIGVSSVCDESKEAESSTGNISASLLNPLSVKVDMSDGVSNDGEVNSPCAGAKDRMLSPVMSKEERAASVEGSAGSMDARCGSSEREDGRIYHDKQETKIQDGNAMKSVLSVSMGVECIAKYQPKPNFAYTFLCGQELRRDQFPNHFHSVHTRIQSDLNGWMEQRCPLAYLGCPFSFRRFRPSNPDMTVCHSWLLESYGLTSTGPHNQFAYHFPSQLLPDFPETVSSSPPEGGAACSQAQHCNSKTVSDSTGKPLASGKSLAASSGNNVSFLKDEPKPSDNSLPMSDQDTDNPTTSNSHSVPYSHPSSSSSSPLKSVVNEKQIMFTGITADSCIRVLQTSSLNTVDSSMKPETSPKMQLMDLPDEVLLYIMSFVDSFSLWNLSLVSRFLRELCSSLLQERGIVTLMWEKQKVGGSGQTWQIVGKRWSFSSYFGPVESWTFAGHNPIAGHLKTCPYNQDRYKPQAKFSIIPLTEEPLNVQIRDMLQDRLQKRRDFRGWIIYSNFERNYISEPPPMVGPLADVLVALGGTLPQ